MSLGDTADDQKSCNTLKDPRLWELYGILFLIAGSAGFVSSTVSRVEGVVGLSGLGFGLRSRLWSLS